MRSHSRPLVVAFCLAAVAACDASRSASGVAGVVPDPSGSSGRGVGSGVGSSSSGGGANGASTSGGSGSSGGVRSEANAAYGGALFGPYTITFGPIQVPPGTENTQCVVKRLGNLGPVHVGQIHDQLGVASHHMILYRVSDMVEQPTPFDCRPFTDTLNPANGNPLIISQKRDDLLTLPPGVAFTLDANQMVRLEMHYINATTSTVTLDTSSTLMPIDPAQYRYDASFLFIGDLDISIPAMSTATLGPAYFPVPSQYASSNFFAITGHEHQWGTNVQVWTATGPMDPGAPVYQVPDWSWSDPVTASFSPPLQVPTRGGFKFQCDWYNQSTSTVSFGESADDEMCFFWAYYYPSQGAQVCFHTDRAGGVNACCPGSALCNLLGP